MPKIDVSVGELFDKLSILEIKKAKGLEVNLELKNYLMYIKRNTIVQFLNFCLYI